jgi:hypothetical protein
MMYPDHSWESADGIPKCPISSAGGLPPAKRGPTDNPFEDNSEVSLRTEANQSSYIDDRYLWIEEEFLRTRYLPSQDVVGGRTSGRRSKLRSEMHTCQARNIA